MKLATHSFKILLAVLLFGMFILGAAPTKANAETDSKIADITDLAGITRDDTGNRVVKNKYATREEFAQMLVNASLYSGDVKSTKAIRLFKDVKQGSAKAPYIQLAVSKGYMSGYLGGKFKPKQAITIKEAAYGMLTALGYTNEDFTSKLTGSRYDKFKELGLGKNISGSETSKLTRTDCENLFYNLLIAKHKSGTVYAATLGYAIDADGKIDYQSLLEKKSEGPYLACGAWQKKLARKLSTYQILKNGQRISAEDISDYSIIYFADQMNTVWVYDKKIYGTLENISSIGGKTQDLTVAGTGYAVEDSEDIRYLLHDYSIEKDSMVVLLLGRDDKVSHVLPMQSRLAGGDWQHRLDFELSKGAIYKNGKRISSSEVKSTDIIYYTKELRSVWVYSKITYGVLEAVNPSPSTPKAIIVAGKTYELKSNPVNSSGSDNAGLGNMIENSWGSRLVEANVQEGDNVAIVFGFDGYVADILRVDQMTTSLSGYVLEVVNKVVKDSNKEGSVQRVARIIETGGAVLEIPTNNTSIDKDTLVEVTFTSGDAEIRKVDTYSGGTPMIFATDIRVIEVKDGKYTKLTPARIREVNLTAGNVLYCRSNSKGEATDLILRYVTDSYYQYGLLKKVEEPDYSKGIYGFRLTFDFGSETVITLNSPNFDINPGPKAIQMENNTIKDMKALQRTRIQYINGKQANSGNSVYRISDDVLVYYYKSGEYYQGSFEDISIKSDTLIDGFMENAQGPIRVIIVNK